MSTQQTIHIVDDDLEARESLRLLCETHGFHAQTYPDADAFLTTFRQPGYGCLVLDLRLPGTSGLELLKQLNQAGCALPVIMVTGYGSVPSAVEAVQLGAVDFIEKPVDPEGLISRIAGALQHNTELLTERARHAEWRERFETLTARELDVLHGLLSGKQNKTIARALGISPRTVETHRAALMVKLRASTVADLFRISVALGLNDTDTSHESNKRNTII